MKFNDSEIYLLQSFNIQNVGDLNHLLSNLFEEMKPSKKEFPSITFFVLNQLIQKTNNLSQEDLDILLQQDNFYFYRKEKEDETV